MVPRGSGPEWQERLPSLPRTTDRLRTGRGASASYNNLRLNGSQWQASSWHGRSAFRGKATSREESGEVASEENTEHPSIWSGTKPSNLVAVAEWRLGSLVPAVIPEEANTWKAGRIAALALFLGGSFWAWHMALLVARSPEDIGGRVLCIPGYLVWALWGLRALNLGSKRLHRIIWTLSLLLHLSWLALIAVTTAATGGLALAMIPLQTVWCLSAAMVSAAFVVGHADA